MISPQTIQEFQEVIKADYGVVLDIKEATEILSNTVAYFDLLAKIDNRKEIQE